MPFSVYHIRGHMMSVRLTVVGDRYESNYYRSFG